jgi:hypothetical protein
MAIIFRQIISYAIKYSRDLALIIFDQLSLAGSIMLATKLRHGGFLNFPDYAIPTVFIVSGAVLLVSMLIAGEYFESKPTIRKPIFGLMISFFVLSSLTYYFKDYEFSRSVLLMTIAFTACLATIVRLAISFKNKMVGRDKDHRIVILGLNSHTESIVAQLQSSERLNADLAGVITVKPENVSQFSGLPVLGNIGRLKNLIHDYFIDEVIVTDTTIEKTDLFRLITELSDPNVKFHIAQDYEQVVTARIIDKVTGHEPALTLYKASSFRIKVAKRIADIAISSLLLTVLFPIALIVFNREENLFAKLRRVFSGKMSLVGLYPRGKKFDLGKEGIIGLATISRADRLSESAVSNLNDYYLQNMSVQLDMDIIIKYIFRKRFENNSKR